MTTFIKERRTRLTHEIKIYPEHFSAVCAGVKRAELRKHDRDYQVGDTLHFMETPHGSCHSTGEFINAKITHIADVGEWIPGYVLLSIEREAILTAPISCSGWVRCSEQMPEKNTSVLISVNFDSDLVEPLICSARYTGSTFRRGQATVKPGTAVEEATHWMPLPLPPQQG